jgi:hypothetical protein
MTYVAATGEFGLVVRKKSLSEKGLTKDRVLAVMADVDVLGENDGVLSFGPLFGEEALLEFSSRLKNIGLEYHDDFFDLNFLAPGWMRIGVDAA